LNRDVPANYPRTGTFTELAQNWDIDEIMSVPLLWEFCERPGSGDPQASRRCLSLTTVVQLIEIGMVLKESGVSREESLRALKAVGKVVCN
jgi:hypothetical protein